MKFTPQTFVERPIRIIHKASESDNYNYFLDVNPIAGTVVVEDSGYRMAVLDLEALPVIIEELKKISDAHEKSKPSEVQEA